jgi:hypothetical protein
MSGATGHYRLDGESKAFFGSPVMHFIQRDDRIIGRFGRRGVVRGSISNGTLTISWKSGPRCGWLKARFNPIRRSFEGVYGLGEATSPPLGHCRACAGSGQA